MSSIALSSPEYSPLAGGEDLEHHGSHSFKENTFTETVESFFLTVSEGLRGVLLVMTKKTSATIIGTSLALLIDCFQLLSLCLLPQSLAIVDQDGHMEIFANFFRIFQFGQKIIDLFGFKVALCVVSIIVLVELFNIAYVAHSWIRKRFEYLWAIKLLRYTTSLLIGVLYIPMVSVMGVMVNCSSNTHLIEEGLCMSLRPFICMILSLFVLVSLVLSSAYIDSSPASGSPASKPHSRVDTFHLFVKTAAALFFAGLSEQFATDRGYLLAWHGVIAVSGMSLAILNMWFLPWFHPYMAVLRCTCMTIFAWVGACMFFSIVTMETANTFVLAMSSMAMIPLSRFVVSKRLSDISRKTGASCRDSFEFEIMIRQRLINSKIIFNVNKQYIAPESQCTEDAFKILQDIDAMYCDAMSRFPSSSNICAFYAEFACAFNLPNSNLQIRKAIIQGESRAPGFAVSFTLFKLRNRLKQKVAKDGDVMSYVASEKYEREATIADRKCCTLLLDFWRELSARHPDMGKVRKLAAQAAELSHRANNAYNQLIKVKPKSIPALNLYSGFLANVANDRKKAVQLSQRVQSINAQKSMRQGTDRLESELSDVFPVISFDVTGEDRSFGEIISANAAAGEFLNEASDRLIRRDLRAYLLAPFAADLPRLIGTFFESGDAPYQDSPKSTFIISSPGDCIEVELRLIPYTTDGMGYCFFVTWAEIIFPASRGFNPSSYLLMDESSLVLACSRQCREILESVTCHPNPVSIDDIFTNFHQTIAQAMKKKQTKNIQVAFAYPSPSSDGVANEQFAYICVETIDAEKITKVIVHCDRNDDPNSPTSAVAVVDDLEDIGDSASVGESEDSIADSGSSRHSSMKHKSGRLSFLNLSRRASNAGTAAQSSPLSPKPQDISQPVYDIQTQSKKVRVADDQSSKSKGKSKNGAEMREEDDQSHTSMGSSASLSAAAIRSALQNQSNDNRLSPILARLQKSYLAMLAMTVGCAVTVLLVQHTLLNTFVDNVEMTTLACLRRTSSVTIAFSAHSLVLLNNRVQLPPGYEEGAIRDEMLSAATRLKALEARLFDMRADLSDDIRHYYEFPTSNLVSTLNKEVTTNSYAMYDATSRFTAKAEQAFENDLSTFRLEEDIVFFLMNNVIGNSSYLESLYTTSGKFSSETLGLHARTLKVTLGTMSLALLVEIVVLFAVMNPIVGGIEQNKTRVLQVFSGIPVGTVRDIALRYQERLTSTHGVVIEGMEEDEQRAQLSHVDDHDATSGTRKATSVLPIDVDSRKPHSSSSKSPSAKKGKKGKKRASGAIASRYGWFLFQLGSAVLISIAYFGISLQYGQQTVMNRFGNVPQQINNFASIRTQTRYALHKLRLLASQTEFVFPDYDFRVGEEDIFEVLDFLVKRTDSIVNGNDESSFDGLLRATNPSPDLLKLMFSDGCHRWADPATAQDCKDFASGILRTGLNSALSDFNNMVKEIVKSLEPRAYNSSLSLPYISLGDSEKISRIFNESTFLTLSELEQRFLRPQLSASQTILAEEVQNGVSVSSSIRVATFASYLTTLLLLYLFVVKGVIKSLDSEVKHTRSLLLMIPEDALDGLRSVQKFLTEEFKDNTFQ